MTRPLSALALSLALPAAAAIAQEEAPSLLFPVDCTLGETCFLQQFVDRDPGPGARAFDCGPQSYDGHTGTDIRVADLAALNEEWRVLAAAPGTVRAVRDGVPDGGVAASAEGQGCGNGVVIQHGGGWETQYCHLARGSIAVTPGQQVAAGDVLGEIGFSGLTEFPHLEFLLRRDGQTVDPFDPSDASACDIGADPLWADDIPVSGGDILSVGFAPGVPDFADIQAGTAGRAPVGPDTPLVLWAYLHGGRQGDIVEFRISDPGGATVHEQRVTLERTQAQLFRASGRRAPDGGWPAPVYRGEIRIIRNGDLLDQQEIIAGFGNSAP